MTLGIYGSSILTLDSKGRVAIPAKYREVLRDICEGTLVITRDPQYPALMIYPGKKWKEVSSKFENLGGLNPKTRSMQWTILGNASVTEFEVSEDATKGQIKKAFVKSLKVKKLNKKVLGEFISLVA